MNLCWRRVAALFIGAWLAVGMGTTASLSAAADEVIVTRDTLRLPGSCTLENLVELVEGLFNAFNGGDWHTVETLLAPSGSEPGNFRVFSWEQEVVQERDRVVPFLTALRNRGERFRLLSLLAMKESGVKSSVAINYGASAVRVGRSARQVRLNPAGEAVSLA